MFDWGTGYGSLPGQIWCFVVVDWVRPGQGTVEFGGIRLENGTYAVVESTVRCEDQAQITASDLFVPYQKDVASLNDHGEVTKRKFYLADVQAITDPICVVPDWGAIPKCKYFHVLSRPQWVEEFVSWLRDPHEDVAKEMREDEEHSEE